MRTTIKSMAMVAVALFAGFGTASAQDAEEEEPVELTKDMFHVWDGLGKDAQPTDDKVWIDWNIGTGEDYAGGTVMCGTSTVTETIYADLSEYSKMEIIGAGGAPRIMFNRTVKEGQQENGGMILVQKDFDEEGAIVIDLKKDLIRTVPDQEPTVDDFAHLVTIKAGWNGTLSIDGIYLYKGSDDPSTGIKDLQAAANNKVVATYNAAGAKVAANAKGLVIKKLQNGKVVKVVNK